MNEDVPVQKPIPADELWMFVDTIIALQVSIDPIYHSLSRERPEWEQNHDVRLGTFSGIHSGLETSRTIINTYRDIIVPQFVANQALHVQAFGSSRPFKPLLDYEGHILSTLFFGVFHKIESAMRSILRAIDSNACERGTAAFESIYTCLLRSHAKTVDASALDLLNLCRNVRNTIHNSGIVHNKRGKDVTAVYESVAYEFRQGSIVELSFEWVFLTVNRLLKTFHQIVRDPAVFDIQSAIVDDAWVHLRPDLTDRRLLSVRIVPGPPGMRELNELLAHGRRTRALWEQAEAAHQRKIILPP